MTCRRLCPTGATGGGPSCMKSGSVSPSPCRLWWRVSGTILGSGIETWFLVRSRCKDEESRWSPQTVTMNLSTFPHGVSL